MLKWIETTGKSEEAAIAAALSQLGMDRDEVSVEVMDRAKAGFLGFGGTPARVKVSYEAPDEPKAAPVAAPQRRPAAAPQEHKAPPASPHREAPQPVKPQQASGPASQTPAPPPPRGEDAAEEALIRQFLGGLMTHMNVDASISVQQAEEGTYQVTLEGGDMGALIGRRGETLDAIQQLTNYAVNRGRVKRIRVHVDAERYRAKREESLQRLAHKVAGKVVKYRRNVTLEPMNAYERHVIHAALQEYPDVSTYSTGTEPNRRTVVAYSKGEHRA